MAPLKGNPSKANTDAEFLPPFLDALAGSGAMEPKNPPETSHGVNLRHGE